MMVGYGDETTFHRDALKLFRRDLIGYSDLFQYVCGKLRAVEFGIFGVNPVHFVHLQELVGPSGQHPACRSFQANALLQVFNLQYRFFLGLH